MAEYQTAKSHIDSSQSIDVGLRAHMNKVYGLMSLAMLITGAVAYAVGTTPALVMAIFGTWLQWVVMLAPLGVVFIFSAKIHSMRTQTAQLVFWIFAALIGLSISYIFLAYTAISIAQTFFTTAVAFGALAEALVSLILCHPSVHHILHPLIDLIAEDFLQLFECSFESIREIQSLRGVHDFFLNLCAPLPLLLCSQLLFFCPLSLRPTLLIVTAVFTLATFGEAESLLIRKS